MVLRGWGHTVSYSLVLPKAADWSGKMEIFQSAVLFPLLCGTHLVVFLVQF